MKYINNESKSTLKRNIDGVLMNVGNPADHDNIKAITRTTVYFLETYSDGSQALKYDNGYSVGIWCGVERLKHHMERNAYISGYKNIIPDDWQLIDKDFFKSLNIITA